MSDRVRVFIDGRAPTEHESVQQACQQLDLDVSADDLQRRLLADRAGYALHIDDLGRCYSFWRIREKPAVVQKPVKKKRYHHNGNPGKWSEEAKARLRERIRLRKGNGNPRKRSEATKQRMRESMRAAQQRRRERERQEQETRRNAERRSALFAGQRSGGAVRERNRATEVSIPDGPMDERIDAHEYPPEFGISK